MKSSRSKFKKILKFIGVPLILIGVALTTYLVQQQIRFRKKAADVNRVVDLHLFSVTGQSPIEVEPSQEFEVDVKITTNNKQVVGVDVVLEYDSSKLELIGITPDTTSNLKTFLPADANGGFDESAAISQKGFGAATFNWGTGQVLSPVSGALGQLARLKFRALAAGTATIDFQFNGETGSESTTDSNVVEVDEVNDVVRDCLRDPSANGVTVNISVPDTCGNGVIDIGEDCDGMQLGGTQCSDLGFDGGDLLCTSKCAFDTSQCTSGPPDLCGNGDIDTGEDCDGTNLNGKDCSDVGYYTGSLSCSGDCTFDSIQCTNCGNNQIDDSEECDGSEFGGKTCQDFGYDSGTLACTSNCTLDKSACVSEEPETCGNGVIDGDDECDGSEFGGKTCQDFDYDSGSLICSGNCTIDKSQCKIGLVYDIAPKGNPDGKVNIFDLSMVLSNWKWQKSPRDDEADINQDGAVNIFDVSLVLTHWTKQS